MRIKKDDGLILSLDYLSKEALLSGEKELHMMLQLTIEMFASHAQTTADIEAVTECLKFFANSSDVVRKQFIGLVDEAQISSLNRKIH